MRINYIDVLKAFAIIAVVLYHAGIMKYGYLGVDLFLVISGYLTTKSLYKALILNKPDRRGYLTFELSRVIRLLPPLLIAGIFCMLMGYFVMLPDDYENLSQSVIATNGFGNNILSAITTKNYWDISNEYKPLMHTWYVGVLMQFYLFYPILFYFAHIKKNPKEILITIISVLAVISLLLYFTTTDTAHRFYYLPSRFFEFATGGIVALVYKSKDNQLLGKGIVYFCYALLVFLMFANLEFIPAIVRLVIVVGLSSLLLCSHEILENKVTGNFVLAKIGTASYSIFIWHQIILAFYRYTITGKFSLGSYVLLIFLTVLLSWLSYRFIEQKTTEALLVRNRKRRLYIMTAVIYILLTISACYIYIKAGVVRNIPELGISLDNVHRGMHAEYCDRGYLFDKPFETNRRHWLVIGNSYGRDIVNIIIESAISDSVEVSYIEGRRNMAKNKDRFKEADLIFLSFLGLNEDLVNEVESQCKASGFDPKNLIVVGEKNFGESNGQVYIKRYQKDYFNQFVDTEDYNRYIILNREYAKIYGKRYLDMMKLVIDKDNKVRVFTPNHSFISEDCYHLTQSGARYYAGLIDWNIYLNY